MGFKTYTCPIAKRCGGCEWLAVPYPIQLRRKQEAIEQLFRQMAQEDSATIQPICGMDEPLAYRYKAATPFAPGKAEHIRSGFYAAGSHRIVRCEKCLVEDPRARDVLNAVARVAERLHIPAYQEDSGTGCLRHAVLRCGYATDDMLLTVVTNGPRLPRTERFVAELRAVCPQVTSIVQNVNDRRTNAILGHTNKTLFGPGIMHDQLLGCTFEIGPTSFYQTNPAQTEKLYALALEGAGLACLRESAYGSTASDKKPLRLLDTYCGTGTIGICAASTSDNVQVTGVEQVGNAVSCARRNADANSVSRQCRFVRADATAFLTQCAKSSSKHFDVVVLDPPRAGSTPEFLAAVAKISPERVVYVSCNPQTQARDLMFLREKGYRLVQLTPVDMFPHTKHVETVAVLNHSLHARL